MYNCSIQAKIPLRDSLTFYPIVGAKVGESSPAVYHLRGVVHHVGSTAVSGHYTSCAKRTIGGKKLNTSCTQDNEEQWVFFDDQVGTKQSMKDVTGCERNQRSCYMALYELDKTTATNEAGDSPPEEAGVNPRASSSSSSSLSSSGRGMMAASSAKPPHASTSSFGLRCRERHESSSKSDRESRRYYA